jgi:hypothetical protein
MRLVHGTGAVTRRVLTSRAVTRREIAAWFMAQSSLSGRILTAWLMGQSPLQAAYYRLAHGIAKVKSRVLTALFMVKLH